MHTKSRRPLAVAVGLVLLLSIGGVAYAYWTSGGTGSGTAATGVSEDIVVNQTTLITNLAPGVAAQTLSGNFTNDTDSSVWVTSVTASIASVLDEAGEVIDGCTEDDYILTDAYMLVGKSITTGTPNGSWTGADIQFNNTAFNQDACQGAIVTLSYLIDGPAPVV